MLLFLDPESVSKQQMVCIHSISTDEKNNARKSSAGKIQGELKLSIEYRKDALLVMVHHAKDLALPDGSKEAPNSYVKVFLNKKVLMQRNFRPMLIYDLIYRSILFNRYIFIQIHQRQQREKQK